MQRWAGGPGLVLSSLCSPHDYNVAAIHLQALPLSSRQEEGKKKSRKGYRVKGAGQPSLYLKDPPGGPTQRISVYFSLARRVGRCCLMVTRGEGIPDGSATQNIVSHLYIEFSSALTKNSLCARLSIKYFGHKDE